MSQAKLNTDPTLRLHVAVAVTPGVTDQSIIDMHEAIVERGGRKDEQGRYIVNMATATEVENRFETSDTGEAVVMAKRLQGVAKVLGFKGITIYVIGNDGHSIVNDIDANTVKHFEDGVFVRNMGE